MITFSRYLILFLSVCIIIRCLRSMLREKYEPEIWAYIRCGKEMIPVHHWEATLGRSASADVRIYRDGVSRIHAVLKRYDNGVWKLYDVFGKKKIWVNGQEIGPSGFRLENGTQINMNGVRIRFYNITTTKHNKLESGRTAAGKKFSPAFTLFELTLLQALLVLQHTYSCSADLLYLIAFGFFMVASMQWICYFSMRIINRNGFEPEILSFFLTSLGMSVAASYSPESIMKQIILVVISVVCFLLFGLWLRKLNRISALRTLAAIAAVAFLALNYIAGTVSGGARNWLEIGGITFQPSELVKVAYIYVGASTLDRLYHSKNLFVFIAFSAVCVLALALMGDFGTALIFFICFLIISFMRSGSIATVLLALSGAAMAGAFVFSVRPYVAQRFASWGHVWEDVYNTGYQQTRCMSAAASGGLIGKGAGAGWLKNIVAANTDMVFGVICEELGLIVGLCAIAAILVLAFFAIRSAQSSRSAYYSIAACAAMTILSVQMALNVFGSMDLLPFTGVTFPFVSTGGTSLISCWLMLAYVKGADTRRESSFAVRPIPVIETDLSDEDAPND
ncbi:MAG: FtsW/RodA/SpoVE family cell cycle protein [Oscillospiraceae bacterium]|nr:FtsW/RodA/SpoVE family cell cycle protein [Oscillospiraceae bacterium]